MAIDVVEVVSSGCSNITVTSNTSPSVTVSSAVASCGGGIDTSLYYLNTNPSGFITAAQGGGVLTLNGLSGILSLTGLGSNTITISGSTIQISGAAVSDGVGITILSGDLQSTGQSLQTQINNITNQTGGFVFTGNLIKYNVFATSGVETEFVSYPVSFVSSPIISVDFENNRDNLTYLHSISGVGLNGFYINYSDFLSTSGYKLHIILNK